MQDKNQSQLSDRSDTTASGDIARLLATVVQGGVCVGCGVCAFSRPDHLSMQLDKYGRYQPTPRSEPLSASSRRKGFSGGHHQDLPGVESVEHICPFGEGAMDEDEIATEVFGPLASSEAIGKYRAVIAGHVIEGEFRERGSSGGFVSWVLSELLARDLADRIVHVRAADSAEPVLFQYAVSSSHADVRAGAKSRYYPIELSAVLRTVQSQPGRYVLVGLPCFVKAVRLLASKNDVIRERIVYYVGLVCGHLKTTRFADLLAWQCGIPPGGLTGIDFRQKLDIPPASRYAVSVRGYDKDGRFASVTRPVRDLLGGDWGQGLLKYKACDYCDDVFAETADISVGDAWLPHYVSDPKGTNIAVVRNADLLELFERGRAEGRLAYDNITAKEAELSQRGGLRHRREGLAYRLQARQRAREWYPTKRTELLHTPSSRRIRVYQLREKIAVRSSEVFEDAVQLGSFEHFVNTMSPLLRKYSRAYRPWWRHLIGYLRGSIVRAIRR